MTCLTLTRYTREVKKNGTCILHSTGSYTQDKDCNDLHVCKTILYFVLKKSGTLSEQLFMFYVFEQKVHSYLCSMHLYVKCIIIYVLCICTLSA